MAYSRAFWIFVALLAGIWADRPFGDVLAQTTGQPITVVEPWARLARDNKRMATVYFHIENAGPEGDTLIGVWTPIADKAIISSPHWHRMILTMRPIQEIAIPPNGGVSLRPGAYQIDIVQLSHALRPGQTIPLELKFARAGRIEITAIISNKLLPDQLRATSDVRRDQK